MNKYYNIKVKPYESMLSLLLMVLFLLSTNIQAKNSFDFKNFTQEEKNTVSNKVSIKKAFLILSKKTSYHFFYNNELKDLNSMVRFNTDTDINTALDSILKNTNLEYKIDGNEVLIRERNIKTVLKKAVAAHKTPIKKIKQSNIITGVVFDDTNMPLPGVNVLVVGKTTGTTTDFDGNFTLGANPEDSIEFSYMGFKNQTVKVGDKTKFSIIMEASDNTLDEVIIAGVASGTSKKKMSVSVTKVKAEDLNNTSQSSIANALSGKIAGASITSFGGSPGSSAKIVMRGANQLSGDGSILILIDGVMMSGSLSDINPNDFESVEFVKGAAASSLYGSKAANGVLVLTSKRGKKLNTNETKITIRSKVTMQQMAKYLELSKSHPYELALDWLSVDNYTKYNFVNYPADFDGTWYPKEFGSNTGDRQIKEDAYMDLPYRVNHDFQKELFVDGFSNMNYLGIAHRGENTNLFLSFEDFKDGGVITETDGYKRNSLRINIDHRFNDKFKISISNNVIKTGNDFMGGGTGAFSKVLLMEPDANVYKDNPDGQKYYYYPNLWSQIVSNPFYDLWRKESTSKKLRFLGSYKANWKINKWLTFNNEYATEVQVYKSEKYTPYGTYNGLRKAEAVGEIDKLTTNNGSLENYSSESIGQTFRSTLQLKHVWDDLIVNGKLSYLYEKNNFESIDVTSNGGFNLPDLPSFNYLPLGTKTEDRIREIVSQNYFAIASLDYKDRYILDGLVRRDGSSLFGPNQRWHTYYRFSGAYRITKDVKIKGIQELKLRMAYGTAGLHPLYHYQYETYNILDGAIYVKGNLGNKDLKPSKSAEAEIGVDISFLDRFYLETSYSQSKNTDQFTNKPLFAAQGGFQHQWVNEGTLESTNFEALLNVKILKQEDLKWNLGMTFSKNKAIITELPGERKDGPRGAFKLAEGEEYGTMYGLQFIHTLEEMANQLPVGENINDYSVNVDGLVVKTADIGTTEEKAFHLVDENGEDLEVAIGNVTPDFRMSFNTKVTYKDFSFYMLWKWKKGGDIYNATAQNLMRDLRHPLMDQIYTKPENKKTVNYYQILYDGTKLNDFWVEDGSYVKLGEAALNYNFTFKEDSTFAKYIDNIKIGLSGSNLLTITNYSGYDPDAGYNGYTFDNYGYPNFRKYTLSFELKF